MSKIRNSSLISILIKKFCMYMCSLWGDTVVMFYHLPWIIAWRFWWESVWMGRSYIHSENEHCKIFGWIEPYFVDVNIWTIIDYLDMASSRGGGEEEIWATCISCVIKSLNVCEWYSLHLKICFGFYQVSRHEIQNSLFSVCKVLTQIRIKKKTLVLI